MNESEREARSQRFLKHVAANLARLTAASREQFDAFGPGALVLRFPPSSPSGLDRAGAPSADAEPVPMGYANRQWAERGNDSNLLGLIETYDPKKELIVFAAYPDGTSDVAKFELPAAAPGAHWEA